MEKSSAMQKLFPPFFCKGQPPELMKNYHEETQVSEWANIWPKTLTKTPAYVHGGYPEVFIVHFKHSSFARTHGDF